MNLVAIAEAAARECVRQQVGIQELIWLLDAYRLTADNPWAFRSNSEVAVVGSMVEPGKNTHGFRTTPVTFRNGGTSANPQEIPRLMATLCEAVDSFITEGHDLTPSGRRNLIDFIVKQFLWIHPFVDGNGRTAFILFNYLNGSMENPHKLPDYFV